MEDESSTSILLLLLFVPTRSRLGRNRKISHYSCSPAVTPINVVAPCPDLIYTHVSTYPNNHLNNGWDLLAQDVKQLRLLLPMLDQPSNILWTRNCNARLCFHDFDQSMTSTSSQGNWFWLQNTFFSSNYSGTEKINYNWYDSRRRDYQTWLLIQLKISLYWTFFARK